LPQSYQHVVMQISFERVRVNYYTPHYHHAFPFNQNDRPSASKTLNWQNNDRSSRLWFNPSHTTWFYKLARCDFRRLNNLNIFTFANICDFGKLFTVTNKSTCSGSCYSTTVDLSYTTVTVSDGQ